MSEKRFTPSEELTFDTVQQDHQRLKALLRDKKVTNIRLDLQSVLRCDSAGLALLIDMKRQCKHHQKELIIDGLSQPVAALAKFCGVEAILC